MATKTYVVGRFNRVYRLDDHGASTSWTNVSPGIAPQNPDNTWLDVMTDPDNPDKVIIVGENFGSNQGVLVSTDAGQTWNVPTGNWNQSKTFYEVWYVNSNIIFAIGDSGKVIKSLDGGVSFNLVGTIDINSVPSALPANKPKFTTTINAISTGTGNNDQTVIVAGTYTVSDYSGGLGASEAWVWKSIDGGNTWNLINSNISLDAGSGAAVGAANGAWIDPANPLNMIVTTTYGQHVSINGGVTFTNNPDIPNRSGRHLTWYPTYAPTVFRHVGGLVAHITESTDIGATWTRTREAENIIIRGAHFYTDNNGYYTVGHRVFTTSTEGVTGSLSFTDPNPDQSFQAIWTTIEQPPQPCYRFVPCNDEIDPIVWSDPILAQYVGAGVIELTITNDISSTLCGTVEEISNDGTTTGIALPIGGPTIDIDLDAAACSQAIDVFDTNVYEFGSESYATCEDCIIPDTDSRCYNLISCKESCPDINYVINDQLESYIGQYISINGDLNCRYLVQATRQAYFNSLQTSDLSDPGSQFQLGAETWNIELDSVLVDGVEYINNPATPYVLTNANYSVVECSELVCTPVVVNTTENCITNVPAYYNQVFANNGIPLSAECADPVYNCGDTSVEVLKIQYNEGSTFTITATFTSNLTGSYQVIYQVLAGNVSQFIIYLSGFDPQTVDTCNDETQCTGASIEITQINAFDNCDFPTDIEIGEACEITPRVGEPGFSTKNCDPDEVIKIKKKFADSVYALFKRMQYGIETCCEYDLDKIDIKNQLIDLGALYDPDLCVEVILPVDCCLQPCNVIAQVLVPNYITCDAPVNVNTSIEITIDCDEPTEVNTSLDLNPVAALTCCLEGAFDWGISDFEATFQIFNKNTGIFNGFETYTALIEGHLDINVWYDGAQWYMTKSAIGNTSEVLATLNVQDCPYTKVPPATPSWTIVDSDVTIVTTQECSLGYDIENGDFLVHYIDEPLQIAILNKNTPTGTYNGQKYWQFEFSGITVVSDELAYTPTGNLYEISFDGTWKMYQIATLGQTPGTGTLEFETNNSTATEPSNIQNVVRDANGWATVLGVQSVFTTDQ